MATIKQRRLTHDDYWSVIRGLERLRKTLFEEDHAKWRTVDRLLKIMHKSRGATGRSPRKSN